MNAEKKFYDLLDTEIARIHEFLESKAGEACMQMFTMHARAPHGGTGRGLQSVRRRARARSDELLAASEEYAQRLVRKGCIVDYISTVTEGAPLLYDDIPYVLQHEVCGHLRDAGFCACAPPHTSRHTCSRVSSPQTSCADMQAVKKHAEAPLLRDLHGLLGISVVAAPKKFQQFCIVICLCFEGRPSRQTLCFWGVDRASPSTFRFEGKVGFSGPLWRPGFPCIFRVVGYFSRFGAGARVRAFFQSLERRGFPGSVCICKGVSWRWWRKMALLAGIRARCAPAALRGELTSCALSLSLSARTLQLASVTMCLAGKVHGLKRFAHINTLGCIKISKKHDKHSNIPLKQVRVCDSGRRHQGLGFKV